MMRFILLLAIFLGFLGFGQVRALTPEDVPEDVKKVVDCSSLTFVVMKQPEFPGGMNEFRKKFSENFDATPLKASDAALKTTIYFVVEPDGTVNRIIAVGDNDELNKEAERTIKSINAKYEPAQVNNMAVRYLMRFPLSMNIK